LTELPGEQPRDAIARDRDGPHRRTRPAFAHAGAAPRAGESAFGRDKATAARRKTSRSPSAPPPATLKASIGLDGGFVGTGAISYAGPGCVGRAKLAGAILRERWAEVHRRDPAGLQMSLIGLNSATPWHGLDVDDRLAPPEIRLRVATQSMRRDDAEDLAREVEALYTNGPAGGGGVEIAVRETVAIISALIPRELVEPRVEVLG